MPGRLPHSSDFPPNLVLAIIPPPSNQPPTNVLILLHGLGDTHQSFARLGQQLDLPETACIALQGPHPLPFELGGFHWGDDLLFDQAGGEMDMDGDFTKVARMIAEDVIEKTLMHKCGYQAREIMMLGYGQGGMAALAAAIKLADSLSGTISSSKATVYTHPSGQLLESELGGVISIGGLLSSTTPRPRNPKLTTPVLVAGGRSASAINTSTIERTKSVFEYVEVNAWRRSGDGMPTNRDEMLPIMQFFGRQLRSRRGLPDDVVEVG